MTNTYLLEVIKAFTPAKRQELALFLTSKYFNRGKNAPEIVRLYQIVLEASPDFSSGFLSKDRVYFQVFGDSTVETGRLEKVIADLNKLLRSYALTQQYFAENNEEQQQIDWAKWLRIHGLADHALKATTKLGSKKERNEYESLERYRINLLLAEEEHEWESVHNQVKGNLGIPKLICQLDLYYHNYRTELTNRYLLQQKASQLPDLEIEAEGLAFYQRQSLLLQISKKIHEILRKDIPAVDEFYEILQQLRGWEKSLSFQTLAQFYAFLRSSCTLMINGGHIEFMPILHEIHKDNLERGYFFVNGYITPNVYLNLVVVALKLLDIQWAKEFTETYKNKVIGDEINQFFYSLNMAQCLFSEKRFEEALDFVPDAPSSSHYHHVTRRLELKIYYELHSDLLLYKIDAFRKFIVRTATKTIAASYRTMDINFLNLLMQLTQTSMKDKARSARLVSRIEGKKLLADRAWLLEKAKELG